MKVRFETNTRGTVKLRNNNTLSAVDHERSAKRHQWKFTHVDALFLGAGLVLQREGHVERSGESFSVLKCLERGQFRLANFVFYEIEGEFFVVALNREDFTKYGLETCRKTILGGDIGLEKFFVRIQLNFDQIRRFNCLFDLAEILTFNRLG